MTAGALNSLLTIQRRTVTDTYGSISETWDDLHANVPCAIEHIGTKEFPTHLKRNSEAQARLVIRYMAGIDPVEHRGQTVDDYNESPVNVRTWNFFPPYDPDPKRPRMWLAIEAIEVK